MFTDVSSLWNSAGSAIQNIGENISSALENLEEDMEDRENAQLSESEIYKKLLDEAQMQHFQLSKQFRVLVSEKESEAMIWKKKYVALSGDEDAKGVDVEVAKDQGITSESEQSSKTNSMTVDDKELLLAKTLAELEVLKSCMQEVEGRLKTSLREKNETTACNSKILNLEREIKELRSRFKETNDVSSSDIKNKTEEIDDLVSEYSKLASESEKQKSSDTQRIREVELENEMLTMRMQALEHSLTELADRTTESHVTSTGTGSSSTSASASPSAEYPVNGGAELKELKARVVHLEYDIKSKDSTIADLQSQQQQQQQSPPSPSSSPSSEDVLSLQLNLSKRMEEIVNLQQDVSRLQIEKKEAESAGKAFYEQYKDLQKSSKDNEGALLAEVQQDLSQAHSEFKASQEEAEGLRAQVAQLQLDLQQQQDHEQQQVTSASKEAEAIKVVEEQLQKANNELTVSATNAADLQEKFTAQEDKLKEAQAKVESLQQEVHEGKAIVAEMSTSSKSEKDDLQKSKDEASRLQQEMKQQVADSLLQQKEWDQKLAAAKAEASESSSTAVDEVTQALTLQLDELKQAHQLALAEKDLAAEEAAAVMTKAVTSSKESASDLQALVKSLEGDVSGFKADLAAKKNELLLAVEAHAADLQEQEVALRDMAEKQTLEQVATKLSQAKEVADKCLQESLAKQSETIRQECEDAKAESLRTLSDTLGAEMRAALDEKDCQHQTACVELTQQHEASLETALTEQQARLSSAHAEAVSALESLRAEEQDRAKQEVMTLAASHQEEVAAMTVAQDTLRLELANIEETNRIKTEEAIAAFRVESEEKLVKAVDAIRGEMASLVEEAEAAREEYLQLYTKESKARKVIHNKLMEIQGNIRVVCRVRPILDVERKQAKGADVDATEILSEEDIVVHRDASTKNRFEFDKVFPPGGTQSAVFAAVQPLIVSVLDGFNVCIFAYGQTGSGKTFTMEGYGDAPEDKGVSPRAIDDLFSFIESATENWTYTVKFSMLEIYNETIRDLLVEPSPGSGGKPAEVVKLDIRQTATGNVVAGLSEVEVMQPSEVLELMNRGQRNRAVGAHDMNEHSSRSHSILTLTVRGVNNKDGSTTCGKLHLIDLAGSERVGKTDATGDRLKEAQNINRSLSALGDVINSLGSKKSSHVPYRNSKLTFLLQDSLGGNSKVLMFVNISPAVYNVSESICSLNFAFRCRNVELGQAKRQVGNGGSSGGSSTPSKPSSSSNSNSSSLRKSTSVLKK